MATLQTARDRARAEVRGEILAMARQHLATDGAAGLSLRAVARDLGLVSSAVYRYFENRDALLTALIVEAYDSLGATAEVAVAASARRQPSQRWVAVAEAIRSWALEHPHEYALLYGTPVPGYAAPNDTVVPGLRVSLALLRVVTEASEAGVLAEARAARSVPPPAALARQLARLSTQHGIALAPAVLFAALLAWTQLFGLLSFELFGQTRGITEDPSAFFRAASATMAAEVGL